jgi:hypothetical protein
VPLLGTAWVTYSRWREDQAKQLSPYIDPASVIEGRDFNYYDPPDEGQTVSPPP